MSSRIYTDEELKFIDALVYYDHFEFLDENGVPFYELDKLIEKGWTIEQLVNARNEYIKAFNSDLPLLEIPDGCENIKNLVLVDVYNKNSESGMVSWFLEDNTKEPPSFVIAFRGSELTSMEQIFNDWILADAGSIFSGKTPQQQTVDDFLAYLDKRGIFDNGGTITSTGHSLGGQLAEYFVIKAMGFWFGDLIVSMVNFDGPGFSGGLLSSMEEFLAILLQKVEEGKIDAVVYQYWVGYFLNHPLAVKEVAGKNDAEWYQVGGRHDMAEMDTVDGMIEVDENLNTGAVNLIRGISNFAESVAREYEDGSMLLSMMLIVGGLVTGNPVLIIGGMLVAPNFMGALATVAIAGIIVYSLISLAYAILPFAVLAVAVYSLLTLFGSIFGAISSWLDKTFSKAYAYVEANPYFSVCTANLQEYANLFAGIANSIDYVNEQIYSTSYSRQDDYYPSYGFITSRLQISGSGNLNSLSTSLTDTINDMESTQKKIKEKQEELHRAMLAVQKG